jgi:hypothetical protein
MNGHREATLGLSRLAAARYSKDNCMTFRRADRGTLLHGKATRCQPVRSSPRIMRVETSRRIASQRIAALRQPIAFQGIVFDRCRELLCRPILCPLRRSRPMRINPRITWNSRRCRCGAAQTQAAFCTPRDCCRLLTGRCCPRRCQPLFCFALQG